MKNVVWVLLGCAVTLLMGCSHSVQTTLQENCPRSFLADRAGTTAKGKCTPSKRDGLTYFLPKKLVKVTLTRKAVPADQLKKLAKAFEDATSDAEKKAKDKADAEGAVKFAEEVLSKFPKDDTSNAKKLAQEQVDKAKVDLLGKAKSSEEAAKKAAQALVDFNNRLMAGGDSKYVQEALAHAQSTTQKYFKALDSVKKAEADLAAAIALPHGTDPERAARDGAIAKAKTELEAANKQLAEATANMKDGLNRLAKVIEASIESRAEKESARPFEDDLALTELPSVPDNNFTFVADIAHLYTREDQVSLSTTSTGLLKSAKGTTNDKTGEILRDAAKIAIMATTGIPTALDKSLLDSKIQHILPPDGGVSEGNHTPEPRTCPDVPNKIVLDPFNGIETKPFVAEFTFDPTEDKEILSLNAQLCQLKSPYLVSVRSLGTSRINPGSDPKAVLEKSVFSDDLYVDGLVYRRSLPYVLDLRYREIEKAVPVSCSSGEDLCKDATAAYGLMAKIQAMQEKISYVRKSAQLLIPNKGPISTVPFRAGWFVKSSQDLTFEDGYPSKMDIERPSEVHAFLQLPLQIMRDIIAVPTDLIKLKVDYSTQETQLLKQQTSQVEAEEKLRKTIEDVQKARSESQLPSQ